METKMQFNSLNVKSFLERFGQVFTVRGYDMKDKIVMVDDVGLCKRKQIKEIKRITDLADYISRSGFLSAFSWWLVISRYTNGKRKFLYEVKRIEKAEVCRYCTAMSCEGNRVIDGMCGKCFSSLLKAGEEQEAVRC